MEKNALTKEEKRQIFKRLPSEGKHSVIKPQLDIFLSAVSAKMRMLPIVSTLSVAMLVVATLNPELIPISVFQTKIIISILLFSVPTSLYVFLRDNEKAITGTLRIIEGYTGKNPATELEPAYWEKIIARIPILMVLIYAGIIIFLLLSIWGLI